jgi:hypothetical protein
VEIIRENTVKREERGGKENLGNEKTDRKGGRLKTL